MKITSDITYASKEDPILKQKLIRSIERLSGKTKIENLYRKIDERHAGKASFFNEALKLLQIDVNYDPHQLNKIPSEGPLVLIANHPFGILDGMILSLIGATSRREWGILVHSKFSQIDHLKPYFLPIDFDQTREAIKTNIQTKKQALEILKRGGAVLIFPAGAISTSIELFGAVTDLEWKMFAAKLIQLTKATVIPIYFHGRNSKFFDLISHFSLTLRLSLIISELCNKMGKSIEVTIGDPIPYKELSHLKNRRTLLDKLRSHTYNLGIQAEI